LHHSYGCLVSSISSLTVHIENPHSTSDMKKITPGYLFISDRIRRILLKLFT
jgi:hypothetical protein